MKKLVSIIAIIIGATLISQASTRSDTKVLEASENIKYLTQKIAKEYIFLYTHQNKQEIYSKISRTIQNLEKNINTIALATKEVKIKQLIDFFAYEKEQIKTILTKLPNIDDATTILDFSEAITEGANHITKFVQYDFSFEERMLMRSKNIEYLIEKTIKYYMVLSSDMEKATILNKMKKSIKELEKEIQIINQYEYPKELNIKKSKLVRLWSINKQYYSKVNSMKMPNLLTITTKSLKSIIGEISIHHSKAQ